MIKDEMTSYERVMAALSLQQPDRVPVVPSATTFSFKNAGYKYSECLFDADKHGRAQLRLLSDFGIDGVWGPSSNAVPEGIGATLRIPEDNPPVVVEPKLKTYEDFEKLERTDITRTGRVPLLLNIARQLRKALGRDVPMFAIVPTPYTLANDLRGAQSLYKDMVRNPEFVNNLMEFCLEPAINYGAALVDAGADVLWVPDPLCGTTCISRRHYERFSYPYVKRMFEDLRSRGATIVYHICGDWHDRLDLASQGPNGWHLAIEADLAGVKREYGDKLALMGNVRSIDVLYGTPEDVERESVRCLEEGAKGGGFILSSDCGLPRDTPPENVLAMVRTGKARGKYE